MTTMSATSLLCYINVSLLLILSTVSQVNSLKCFCNVCTNSESECNVSEERGSFCYKSILGVLEGQAIIREYNYGCISTDPSDLGHLQCHIGGLPTEQPLFVECCSGKDFCNEEIPDPEGGRWNETHIDQDNPTDFKELTIALLILILIVALLIYGVYKLITVLKSKLCTKARSTSTGSTCSLKADLEAQLGMLPNITSSTASTHSCSISEEASYMPEEITSGFGERMLNQRTMARAVGFGKTDHVGNGRFGRVFRGQYHGEDVAVKAFRTIDEDSWKREDTILRTLNHENVVRFIASEVTSVENCNTEIWMFLEYCPYGSLCDHLDLNEVMGPQQAVKILYSIVCGLNYLHEEYGQYKPSIAHRDIKSKNILVRSMDSCCIADFGHALIKVDERTLDYGKYRHLQVGTVRYMAPEILKPQTEYNINFSQFATFAQADLYQFGLILWEVCQRTALDILHPAGRHMLPYDGVVPNNPDILDMIKIVCDDQYRPPILDKWEKHPMMKRLADLMVECWRPNPKARMETLGVKKKLKELYDQVVIPPRQYQLFNYANERDKTKSSEATWA